MSRQRPYGWFVGLALVVLTATGSLSTAAATSAAWCGDALECAEHAGQHTPGVPLHDPCVHDGGCAAAPGDSGLRAIDLARPADLSAPDGAFNRPPSAHRHRLVSRLSWTGPEHPPRVTS